MLHKLSYTSFIDVVQSKKKDEREIKTEEPLKNANPEKGFIKADIKAIRSTEGWRCPVLWGDQVTHRV